MVGLVIRVFVVVGLGTLGYSAMQQSVIGDDSKPAPVVEAVGEAMEEFVRSGQIAGAVTVVTDDDSILHLDATGMARLSDRRPMRADSLFWIASMTKPVTAAAVMILAEEGKLSLDDPISQHLPAMAGLRTADGDSVTITIRQLLSHTSGMADLPAESYRKETLEAVAADLAKVDVLFQPGSRWKYSQSGINTAARIVEVVSQQSFDAFVQQRIFDPLGMKDTTFYPTPEQAARLAATYRIKNGAMDEVPIVLLQGLDVTSRAHFPAGNGGLFSTGPDYARFCQMLLGEGTRDDVQVLQPRSVKEMRSVVTGDLAVGFTPGNGWGIGVCVVRDPQGVTAVLSPGSYGHGGAYGTQAWIDPVANRAFVLMIQRSDLPNSDDSVIRRKFQEAFCQGRD